MAQIRKLQGGNIINNIPATKYFSIGNVQYDFNKFQNLVWHNFDSWIESNDYNNKVKSETKKFINIVLDQLNRGVAKINSDLSIVIEDKDNTWDNRPGFNKKGPKIFHFITDDKIDDNRGIPHIAMNYLQTILKSQYMIKKPQPTGVPSLTDPVVKNIIKLDFNSNASKFANPNFGFMSHEQYDRIGMFKKALENYRDNTDFSIYNQEDQKKIKDNIDKALNLLNTTTDYNEDFFKKISSYGFYGAEKYLNKSNDQLAKEQFEKEQKLEDDKSLVDLKIYTNKLREEIDSELQNGSGETGSNELAKRKYSKNDYLRYAAPEITKALQDYYSILPQNWTQVTDWKRNNKLSFWTPKLISEPLQTIKADLYLDLIDDVMQTKNISRAEANNLGKALARQLTRFLLGRNTDNFKASDRKRLENNVKVVMSMANARNGFTPISSGYFVLPDSYDRETKTYTAFDATTNTLFAIPEIFVKNSVWDPITSKINAEMKRSRTGSYMLYSSDDIRKASLKQFLRGVSYGSGTAVFNDILKFKLPKKKKGGILKALTGAEITQQILNDTSGLYSEQVKAFNRGYDDGVYSGSNEAERIRVASSQERKRREAKRQQVQDVREAKSEAERERKKQDFLDDENQIITSWKDLAGNLTTHDKLVVGTLLSDLVALGGSISGGAFNPVTDAAVLLSTIGTVGAIYTDDSLNPLQKLGYGVAGVGLNLLGLVPEVGAAAGMYKLANVARKALPILSKVIKYGSIGLTGLNALGPLKKLAYGEDLTKGEWKSLAYFTEALILGRINSKGVREFKKYTKPVKADTKYEVRTKSGRSIQVTKDVYEKLDGAKIKTLKENYGKPETALKDIHGNEINIESLSTRGTISKIKGDGTVKGKVTPISEGIRLKSLEEMHAEFGIPKITINGKTTYQVPKNYLNLSRRLGQQPLTVIDDAGAETIVAKETPKPKETTKPVAEEPVKTGEGVEAKSGITDKKVDKEPTKDTGKETGNDSLGNKPKEGTDVSDTNKNVEQPVKNQNLGPNKEKLQQKIEETSKKLSKINDDVKDFVKYLISARYEKDPGVSYTSRRDLAVLMRKIQNFKEVTKGKLPTKYLEPGTTYYVSNKGAFVKQTKNSPLKVGKKVFKSESDRDTHYKDWKVFKFQGGGYLDFLKNIDSSIPKSNKEKAIAFGKKFVNDPNLWYWAAAINSKRFYDYQRDKQKQFPYTTQEVPNTIRYSPSDYYGAKSQAYKTIGSYNTLAGKTFTSDLDKYLNFKYNTSIVANNSVLDTLNSTLSTKRDTELKELDTKLEALDKEQRLAAYENAKQYNAWKTNQLTYDIAHEQNVSGLRQQWLDDRVKDAVDWKKSRILHNMVQGQQLKDLIGPYAQAIDSIEKDKQAIYDKYGSERGLLDKVSTDETALADFKKLEQLNKDKAELAKLKTLYDEDYMFNISQGFDIQPQLKTLLKHIFKVKDTDDSIPDLAIKNSKGGSLSYSQRMSLKEQDSLKERQKYIYKLALQSKKQIAEEDKQRRKDFNEAQKLLNEQSKMLLKASLGI